MEHRTILKCLGMLMCVALLRFDAAAFDNRVDHPTFNGTIADKFVSQVATDALSTTSKFAHYQFVLNGSAKLSGTGVKDTGWTSVNEGTMELNPRDWITHGGYAADEPEMPAGVRHFYDPLGIDGGKKWLTDVSGSLERAIKATVTGDPQIDAKNWAFHYAENRYNWAIGKASMKKALQESDPKKRATYMAKAWRCLGETLHLIADMALPPHVRNDSHPASGNAAVDFMFGDPGPCEALFKTAYINDNLKRSTETSLKDAFSEASTAEEIFDSLAHFTNRNFFSGGTIKGTGGDDYEPLITSRPAYPAPKLEDCDYHAEDFYYYKTFPSGTTVKLCRDLRFIKRRGYPYIDGECVKSMAAVWVPAVVEAGKHAMARFIPSITVTISDYDASTGEISGTVDHSTDDEYTSSIMYNGPVIITDGVYKIIDTIDCANGSFNGKLKEPVSQVAAEIAFGGITVKSTSSEGAERTFNLVTKPARAYANEPCTLVVTGSSLPKGCGVSWDILLDDGTTRGYYNDTTVWVYPFKSPKEYRVKASVLYSNTSRIWKTDTFTITINDTVIIDSTKPDPVALGRETLVIFGRHFGDTGTVLINNTPVDVFAWNSSNRIYIKAPFIDDSIATVIIKTRDVVSEPYTISLVEPPEILSVSPTAWQYPGRVSIVGRHFGTGETNYDQINFKSTIGGYSIRYLLDDTYEWSDTCITFALRPESRSGLLWISRQLGTSDSVPVTIIPNLELISQIKLSVSITGCTFENHEGTVTNKSVTFGLNERVTSRSSRELSADFDSSYTLSTSQYTQHRFITLLLDTSLEKIEEIKFSREDTRSDIIGSKSVAGDTIHIRNLSLAITPNVGGDTLTGYYVQRASGDTLLSNIVMLHSLNHTITSDESGNKEMFTKLTNYPTTLEEGKSAYVRIDLLR